MNIELVGIGLVVGAFIGISGVGGGSIMTPVLILVLGINPLAAVGTDLLYSVPTKILGGFLHNRQETIDWKIVRALLWGGVPGAVAGILLLFLMRHYFDLATLTHAVKVAVGCALFVSAGFLVYSILLRGNRFADDEDGSDLTPGTIGGLTAAGAGIGFFVSLTSIGSGAMTLPILLLLARRVRIRKLIGSDIAFAAFLIPVAAAGHGALGDINYGIALNLLLGSLPGVYIGSRLCKYLAEIWLRPAVAMVLVIAASRMF